jgi:hypothetical protein
LSRSGRSNPALKVVGDVPLQRGFIKPVGGSDPSARFAPGKRFLDVGALRVGAD